MKRHSAGSAASSLRTQTTSDDYTDFGFGRGHESAFLSELLARAGLELFHVRHDPATKLCTVIAIQLTESGAWQTFSVSVDCARLRRAYSDCRARRLLALDLAGSLATRHSYARADDSTTSAVGVDR